MMAESSATRSEQLADCARKLRSKRVSEVWSVLDDLFDILHRGDQVILDALAPNAAIAGALEVVVLCRLAKAPFDERHAPTSIAFALAAVCLRPAAQEQFVAFRPDDQPGVGRMGSLRTLRAEGTDCACRRVGTIVPTLFILVVAALGKALIARANEGVSLGVVDEFGDVEDVVLLGHAS